MPIRFRCLGCNKSLASASCLAGKRVVCPACKASLVVPPDQISEPDPPAFPVVTSVLPPSSLAQPRSHRALFNIAWAGGVLALAACIAAALGMALRDHNSRADSGVALPATTEDATLVASADQPGPPAGSVDSEFEPDEDTTSPDIEARSIAESLSNASKRLSLEQKPESADRTADKAAPANKANPAAANGQPVAEAKIVAAPPRTASSVRERWTSKRRSRLSDNEMRSQLLLPPALDLESSPGTTSWLIKKSPKAIASGVDLIPQLTTTRPDMFGLPLQTGSLARMSLEEALNLKVLSGRLRVIIQSSIPGALDEVVDPRPDHEVLRRLLLNNPQNTLWLRPQAISTLRQLLIAEHKNVRLILVDLLSNISGRISSMILAERAVFDLDPDVRLAALVALSGRPEAEYESALIAGLRYPWPVVAEHAAEALVALNLKEAVPKLATMLDTRDMNEPYTVSTGHSRRAVVPELVRINHLRNCLMCHSYSSSPSDPIRGLVPNAEHRVPLPVASTPLDGKGWGGGGSRPSISVVTSTFVRPDVTFLRQDFSVIQPVAKHGRLWPADQRFDYLVRLRPLGAGELVARQNKLNTLDQAPVHTEPLLFALRELTGESGAVTAADWKRLYSPITGSRFETPLEPAELPKHLIDCLVEAAPRQQIERLAIFREKTGGIYDTALAQAIPQLSAEVQKSARTLLADRVFCMPVKQIATKLAEKDEEMRRAGLIVSRQRKLKSLTPEVIDLLGDANTEIAGQAHQVLQHFAAKDFGPRRGADQDARQEAIAAWRDWWDKQAERMAARKGAME